MKIIPATMAMLGAVLLASAPAIAEGEDFISDARCREKIYTIGDDGLKDCKISIKNGTISFDYDLEEIKDWNFSIPVSSVTAVTSQFYSIRRGVKDRIGVAIDYTDPSGFKVMILELRPRDGFFLTNLLRELAQIE